MRTLAWLVMVVSVCAFGVFGQKADTKPIKKIQIVLLGTFHFGATGDKNRTNFDDEFSPQRQAQIGEVVGRLAKYNPDKIFVEQEPSEQAKWDKILADYKNGVEPTGNNLKNEIFQIAVKLAKSTNNPNGVICVDYQMPTDIDAALKNAKTDVERNYINRVKAIGDAPEPKNSNEKFFFLPFQRSKEFKPLKLADSTLLNYYVWFNSPESIAQIHYTNDNYLALALGENENYVGAEYVDLWYNRNLKIFTNILRHASLDDKRYLLLIGGAHVKVLRDFFAGNPYFEIVEAEKVLRSPTTAKSKTKKV